MPVEIKELHIKAVVSKAEKQQQPQLKEADIRNIKKEIIKINAQILMQLKIKCIPLICNQTGHS